MLLIKYVFPSNFEIIDLGSQYQCLQIEFFKVLVNENGTVCRYLNRANSSILPTRDNYRKQGGKSIKDFFMLGFWIVRLKIN
ncbi:hypothetical protein HME9304_00268 [Flagellimonas maritima]|uniref:Uncharacterized protein n=1 Tax=Flagellimonas maritima TaxID=1383885 RepID=A0A2Z4LN56_9FLAO|nr:hypothetical protein HME9304_00268 [Allomuricauda aurantiaca]